MKYYFLILYFFTSCAVIVRPSGGPKDEEPPQLIHIVPDSNQLNFKKNKIILTFDEYIEIDDVNGLTISPPPVIKPKTEIKNKSFYILLSEPLKDSTTYQVSLTEVIHDLNEKNKFSNLTWRFSTYQQIDSAKIEGTVIDNLTMEPVKGASVALLPQGSDQLPDSLWYPIFITKTDQDGEFIFSNLAPNQQFLLYAFKDINNNLRVENEEFAGYNPNIVLSNDSTKHVLRLAINLNSFKTSLKKQYCIHNQLYALKFNHFENNDISFTTLNANSKNLLISKTISRDSFLIFINDTLTEKIIYKSNHNIQDTISLQSCKKVYQFTKENNNPLLSPDDSLILRFNAPLRSIRHTQWKLFEDSIPIKFTASSNFDQIYIDFNRKPEKQYQLILDSLSIADPSNQFHTSDTINFKTENNEKYGSISLEYQDSIPQPILFQLLKPNSTEVLYERYSLTNQALFNPIKSGEYSIRIIFEDSKSPQYMQLFKYLPSKVIYHPEVVKLRGGWSIDGIKIESK